MEAACLVRCDPALDHTSGFFVAVFERVAVTGAAGASAAATCDDGDAVDAGDDGSDDAAHDAAAPAMSRSKRRRLRAREKKLNAGRTGDDAHKA
jgi:hypothetical protein